MAYCRENRTGREISEQASYPNVEQQEHKLRWYPWKGYKVGDVEGSQ